MPGPSTVVVQLHWLVVIVTHNQSSISRTGIPACKHSQTEINFNFVCNLIIEALPINHRQCYFHNNQLRTAVLEVREVFRLVLHQNLIHSCTRYFFLHCNYKSAINASQTLYLVLLGRWSPQLIQKKLAILHVHERISNVHEQPT